ncbi:MAG TPA: response regulator [Bacteroidia bacterium]|jgi:two-component system response regulator
MQKPGIILIEDSFDDAECIQRGFQEENIRETILHFSKGQEALKKMLDPGSAAAYKDVRVVILDLRLHDMDGREVLTRLKENMHFKNIPVVILTTSDKDTDINECRELGASSYISKPASMESFQRAVITIAQYWKMNKL